MSRRTLSQVAVFSQLARAHMGRAPLAVAPGTAAAEVVRRMAEAGASNAVVAGADGRPVGIVTEQDVVRKLVLADDPARPVESVMSAPVVTIRADDYLYQAIALMRRHGWRHMPVVDADGRVVGTLELYQALSVAAAQMVGQIDRLAHDSTLAALREAKRAQIEVAAELFRDALPAPEIQTLLTRLNNDLYRRVVAYCVGEMAAAGRGAPPVAFDVIVMGSGGRGESFLYPDQDNGFILADYPDEKHDEIDGWFIDLAERMVKTLDAVGVPYCLGNVMAVNPLWRKTISQWRRQISLWVGKGAGQVLRLADIFFDFVPVYGAGAMAAELRDHVTATTRQPFFLREMFRLDEEFGVALGLFGRLITDRHEGPNRGKLNLKLTGTLPLVDAVRTMALAEGVAETSTRARIDALAAKGVLDADEQDYLIGAYRHITGLLLRQQLADFEAGRPVGNHVAKTAMSRRERDMLIDAFRAIRRFRERLRAELSGEVF